jgi:uncharacterized protein YjeT (DUF2065 family)
MNIPMQMKALALVLVLVLEGWVHRAEAEA